MKKLLFLLLVLSASTFAIAQTATLRGVLLNENNEVLMGVNIEVTDVETGQSISGTISDASGFYKIEIPANRLIQIRFSYVGYKAVESDFLLKANEQLEFNPVLSVEAEQISSVVITAGNIKRATGITQLDPETIRKIPGANAGVENLLKSLPGVSFNNELSTQFNVRGGNFDENLIYINGIEVYKPFLIRSGQQEGLSVVNSDLTHNVEFSAGGFQSKYGDRMSSVLDITYLRPTKFMAGAEGSFLGASGYVGGINKSGNLSGIFGVRYRDNSLLVNSRQTEAEFTPTFVDVQGYVSYQLNPKWEIGFLGFASLNEYFYEPFTQQTNFGTFEEPRALLIFFEGQEDDEYNSYMGALKTSYKASENTNLHLSTSVYHTQEQEHFSILAQYLLGDVNTDIGSQDFGSIQSAQGIGSQLENGRNDLDAIIANVELKGDTKIGTDLVEWGVKFQHEDFRDRLREFEVIDSAGFSIRPPGSQFINDQPYNAFDAPLVPFTGARALNDVQVNRFSGFAQYSGRTFWNQHEIWYNLGVRAQRWDVSGTGIKSVDNFIVSPRAQIAVKPKWKQDMIFRFATGLYQQPPFYREFRDQTGAVNPEVDAQKSLHFVLGHDYSFKMWGRPFKLVSELYYKDMTDINRFTVENVRIRYVANNDAEAYAVGFDTRLNGEFVPGTDSWISIGYLKTLERFDERGYISRPTDQRLKVGVLFQDYVPNMPSLRMYLNMVYNTGVPGGSPSFADPHDFQFRLDDYFRADVGIFYVLADQKRRKNGSWLDDFQEFSLGFEIFNVFDRLNTITNTWVRDAATKQEFAVPNFLTSRVFNLRMSVKI